MMNQKDEASKCFVQKLSSQHQEVSLLVLYPFDMEILVPSGRGVLAVQSDIITVEIILYKINGEVGSYQSGSSKVKFGGNN